jgi:hypothetical protein
VLMVNSVSGSSTRHGYIWEETAGGKTTSGLGYKGIQRDEDKITNE